MKMKIIGILIVIMLLTTIFAVAKPYETRNKILPLKEVSSTLSGVDVPVWEIGDTWTYRVDNISLSYNQDNQAVDMYLAVSELPLVVIDTTGDYYRCSFETSLKGHGQINTDQGSGPVNISTTFDSITISGHVLVQKSTLGVKEISAEFVTQKFTFDIINQPYINLPSWLSHISARMTMNITSNLDNPVTMLTFPLNIGNTWGSMSTDFTLTGRIECLWFNLLYFLNNLAKLINSEFLPAEIAALLPIIDIQETLTALGPGNVFQIPAIPYAFYCTATENITVEAGSYEAYNINVLDGSAQCYYAPTAGNIIKITGDFEDVLPNIKHISMELISTNYS
jgi:hypothetical protein